MNLLKLIFVSLNVLYKLSNGNALLANQYDIIIGEVLPDGSHSIIYSDTTDDTHQECSDPWKVYNKPIKIDSSIPINTPFSPEEIKDVAALFDIHLTDIIK